MEHILISPGKLKLILTPADVEHYELPLSNDVGTERTERNLRALLDELGGLGFDPGNDRLFVQLYPSKDGGAEIYITKLCEKPDTIASDRLTITHIGCFDTLEELLCCCERLVRSGFGEDGDSEAFYEDSPKRWFLILYESMSCREYLDRGLRADAIIGEYGRNIKSHGTIYYIKEHCFIFCKKKAVKILGSMV